MDWMVEAYRREPMARRVQKTRMAMRLNVSRPTLNKYLAGGGIPFPFPPDDHLVWITDVDDIAHGLLWVSPSLCEALGVTEDQLVGHDPREVLQAGAEERQDHREEINQLIRGERDAHDCHAIFVRKSDGYWIHCRLKVTYGAAYRVWFADAVMEGAPEPPPSVNNVVKAAESTMAKLTSMALAGLGAFALLDGSDGKWDGVIRWCHLLVQHAAQHARM